MEVTLKEAATLCKKSEKTLRRKIEAGLLDGRKEPLEFGGFMWMIDVESLDELYPGSRPSNLPQVYDAPEPPQVRLKNRPEDEAEKEVRAVVRRERGGGRVGVHGLRILLEQLRDVRHAVLRDQLARPAVPVEDAEERLRRLVIERPAHHATVLIDLGLGAAAAWHRRDAVARAGANILRVEDGGFAHR